MTLKEIACRNIMRRKSKAAFILAGLVIGVATVVTVISLVNAMTSDITEKLDKYGANILVVPKTENLPLTYGGLSLGGVSFEMQEIREEQLARIKTIKNAANLAAVGPMVLGVIQVRDKKVLLAGVDFKAARILKPWWKIDGVLPDADGVLIGSEAAKAVSLAKGSSVAVKGRRLTVAGVLQPTGSQDDRLVFTRLATAQALLDKQGRVSMAEVAALCTACPIDAMVTQISEKLPGAKVMAIQQVVKGRMETLQHFKKFSYGVSAVVILIGGLVVLVTMMGSVKERTEEIGIFRAVGFRKRHVMQIILLEAAVVSAIAGVLGYLLGFGATRFTFRFFTESRALSIPPNAELAAAAFVMAIVIGILSGIYPALMASRMDPNDALRAL